MSDKSQELLTPFIMWTQHLEQEGGVTLLTWGKLDSNYVSELEHLIYGQGIGRGSQYTEESIAKFQAFCAEHNIYYYAEQKEDFFIQIGYDEARAANCKYLIADNMS